MKNKKDRIIKHQKSYGVLIILIILVILSFAIFYYYQSKQKTQAQKSFAVYLNHIDNAVQEGYFRQAQDYIQKAMPYADSAAMTIRLLKRTYAVSRALEDYTIFTTIAEHGYKQFPARTDLTALYAWSLLQTNKITKAAEVAQNKLIDTQYEAIHWQIIAHNRLSISEEESDKLPDYLHALYLDSAESFAKLAEETAQKQFYLHAALLCLREGDPHQAYHYVDILVNNNLFNDYGTLFVKIAYDGGYFEKSLTYIDQYLSPVDSELSIIQGDIYLHLNDYEKAYFAYKNAIDKNPAYNWVPYLNRAYAKYNLDGEDKISDSSWNFIEQGITYFSDHREFVPSVAYFLYAAGYTETGIDILSSYVNQNPGDTAAGLLLARLSGPIRPERYRALLWEVVHHDPSYSRAFRYLCWFLLGIEDFTGLRQAIDLYERENEKEDWTLFYRAILQAAQSNYIEAVGLLEKGAIINLDNERHNSEYWVFLYNQAIAYVMASNYQAGIELLQKAHSLTRYERKTEIEAAIARTYYLTRDNEQALYWVRKVLETDPHHIKALLLQRKLEI